MDILETTPHFVCAVLIWALYIEVGACRFQMLLRHAADEEDFSIIKRLRNGDPWFILCALVMIMSWPIWTWGVSLVRIVTTILVVPLIAFRLALKGHLRGIPSSSHMRQ